MSFNEGVSVDTSHASRGRGGRGGGIAVGGGVGGLVIVLIALFLGVDPGSLTGGGGTGQQPPAGDDLAAQCQDAEDANTNAECRIIATENSLDAYWSTALTQAEYQRPQTVVFQGQTDTGCGAATSAVGPFYCPTDTTMYFDASFFDVLTEQFGSSGGPLAQEYVVAHEFGHHVQNLLGVLGRRAAGPAGRGLRRGAGRADGRLPGRRVGQQRRADRRPGHRRDLPRAAHRPGHRRRAVGRRRRSGDDRIQEKTQGQVNPEAWTHGSSEQRQRWFTTGYQSGDLESCNTLEATDL